MTTMADEVAFDGWTLHRSTGELRRGTVRVRLQSQPLQVLEALLERPGELVTRAQLIARLWPRGIVEFDTALNTVVRRLRTTLGDCADQPRYIETLPRRGYRFVAPLEPIVTPTATVSLPAPVTSHATPASQSAHRPAPSLRVAFAAMLLVGAALLPAGSVRWDERAATPDVHVPISPAAAEAQDLYDQARFLLQRRRAGDIGLARQRFESAVARSPGMARAWAGIASTHWLEVAEGRVPREQGVAEVLRAASRALQLDPAVAEAHLRLANVASSGGDRTAANTHLRRAVELEPGDPLVLAFASSDAAGRNDFAAAAVLQRRAVLADPLSSVARFNLAVYLFLARDYAAARRELETLRALHPDARESASLLAQTLVLERRYLEAIAVAESVAEPALRQSVLALAYHALGRRVEADRALRSLTRAVRGRSAYMLAEVHAFRGEPDLAFRQLSIATRASDDHCADPGCWPLEWLPDLPLLQSLSSDARWRGWVTELRTAVAAG